ncbi:MAG: hypothetical protein JO097_00905 [Acidobacteriaceae bacterium]|nr:hypothetical protein [Acidobacteriaceae bacterium]MBV9297320.1 hypothetical protein [Acidobacteriaceae bacterium]MBV9765158.1 hypothetical protein [Acidobacteriaceae bacterium]
MRRALFLCLGIVVFTWLEFQFFPGHTYLRGDSQIYVPVLERLDTPGYLSRDLVATHPHVTYTIYDEVTLFLHVAGRLTLQRALEVQQVVCRAAAIAGIFLLVLSTGLGEAWAFLVAVLLNLGATLAGPAVELVQSEPLPVGFAFALSLLAMGFLAREKPLLAGLSGGIACVYHPATAAPFWGLVLLVFAVDRSLRKLFRPALTILVIFALLLGNLAQLQPGIAESQPFFGKLSANLAELQQYRTPYVWVSLWAGADIWHYLAIWICGLWATTRIWASLNRQVRWFLLVLPTYGILSVPLSYLLLERFRWSFIPEVQPARALLFTVAMASLACGVAGIRAAQARRRAEAFLWLLLVFALPMNTRILDFLRLSRLTNLAQLILCVAFAAALTALIRRFAATRWRLAVLGLPILAILAFAMMSRITDYSNSEKASVIGLADWAETNTWGSSVFLFPDAGRELYPGIFRAQSRRALWVDWESGDLVDYFESAGIEWWNRWQQTMQDRYSTDRLESSLSLPIDYYVLKQADRLADVKQIFENRAYVVYDARDLRKASAPLRNASMSKKLTG